LTLKTVTSAFNGFFDFTAKEALLVGVVTAIVQFGTAFAYGVTPADLDFSIFLRTTERFLEGQAMYSPDAMDFTPPLFHVLLFPLAHTDPRIAFTLWTAANVGIAWIVLRMVLKTVPGAWDRRWVIAAWVANAAGVHMTIRLGQVSWLVALLVTCAWLAARSSRWVSAGVWAGLAIAFKPFLLVALPVFVVRKQWRVLVVCTTTIAASCGVGALVFGWPALTQWIGNLRATPDPAYATHFLNASWLGLIARAGLPYFVSSVLSGATIVAVLWRVRSTSEDEAWLLFSIAAILGSPVGWVYYQPMLLGPVVALAINGRWNSLRWLAFTGIAPALSKNLFQTPTIIALTLGSVYFWGFLVTLVALMLRPQTHFAVARWRDARSFFRAAPAAELRRTQVP
jgi:alpha-1,2-mannosyltransferase